MFCIFGLEFDIDVFFFLCTEKSFHHFCLRHEMLEQMRVCENCELCTSKQKPMYSIFLGLNQGKQISQFSSLDSSSKATPEYICTLIIIIIANNNNNEKIVRCFSFSVGSAKKNCKCDQNLCT